MTEQEPLPSLSVPRRGPVLALLVAMRPKQWTKNLLLFAGLLFTLDQHHTLADFQRAGLGFFLFSLLSSVVYLVNDVLDRDSDRLHPKKRKRPIASGQLSPRAAIVAAVVIGLVSLVSCFALSRFFGIIASLYFLQSVLYSFKLKHEVILDVLALAAGFVLRAMAGAVLVSVSISPWLILCTMMLALFLGLSKRRAELIATTSAGTTGTRRILEEYSPEMLDQMIVIVTSACLMSYTLYTVESPAARQHHYLMLTIPFVLYGIFRYLYLMHRHALGESPDTVLLEDRPMLVNVALWGLTTALIVTHVVGRVFTFIGR